jgi:hypothetical protein
MRNVNLSWGSSDYYEINNIYKSVTYTEYLIWLRETYPQWFANLYTSSEGLPNLYVDKEVTLCDVIPLLQQNNYPLDLDKYCMNITDVINHTPEAEQEEAIKAVNSTVDLMEGAKPLMASIISNVKKLEKITLNIYPLTNFDEKVAGQYGNSLYYALNYKEELAQIQKGVKTLSCASYYQGKSEKFITFIEYLLPLIQKWVTSYEENKAIAKANLQFLHSIMNEFNRFFVTEIVNLTYAL